MTRPWNTLRRTLAVLCALAALAASTMGLQGLWPGLLPVPEGVRALAPVAARGVWVAIDNELWLLGAHGQRERRLHWRDAGLPGRPASLAAGPQGLLVQVNGQDSTLYVLDPALGTLTQTLRAPPVPPGRRPDAPGATLALNNDGQIALLTHRRQGSTLQVLSPHTPAQAQTQSVSLRGPEAPVEAQGLWWDGHWLWVSVGSDNTLLALRSDDLSVLQRVALPRRPTDAPPIQHIVGHPRHGMEAHAPLATAIRRPARDPSVTGPTHLVHLWTDGLEIEQDLPLTAQPQALAWLGEQLLVADAERLQLRRFDTDRRALPDFGDAEVQTHLRGLALWRSALVWPGTQWATLAGALGLLSALLWPRPRPEGVSTPARPAPEIDRGHTLRLPPPDPTEAWLNRAALRHLQRLAALAQTTEGPWLAPGEHLREVFTLQAREGTWWMLLTNRQLVQARWSRTGPEVIRPCLRGEIVRVSLTLPARPRFWQAARIDLELSDGHSLSGQVRPLSVAKRVVTMLQLPTAPSGGA